MSLIFNGFKDRIQAEAFERAVKERFPERRTAIWMSYDEMAEACMARKNDVEADVFLHPLDPPIVLVSRIDAETYAESGEPEIEAMVEPFGGVFVGT